LSYDAPVTDLVGRLVKRTFFGPPGYGENPKTDSRETQAVLVLDSPACASRGAELGDEPESNQREVTLVAGDGVVFGPSVGKRIAVSGELFHAITGHHHTKLLVRVSRVSVVGQ
jgi:hypothetical protein